MSANTTKAGTPQKVRVSLASAARSFLGTMQMQYLDKLEELIVEARAKAEPTVAVPPEPTDDEQEKESVADA